MRTTIDQHISDLLYYHECVVVPGFGAFLTRYFSAEVHSATNMFRPPSKRVAFNARINDNDGLLAKHVATVEGVSYQRALESIAITVRSWQRILRSGKKINLHGVGRLFYDEQGLLQFNPTHDVNYNIKSYGLNIFRATAMEREQKIKRSVNRAIENHKTGKGQKMSTRPEGAKNTNYVKYGAIAAGVAALIFGGGYVVTQPEARQSISGFFTNLFSSESPEANEEVGSSMADSISATEAKEQIDDADLADDKTTINPKYGVEDDVYTSDEVDDEYNTSLYNVKEKPPGAEVPETDKAEESAGFYHPSSASTNEKELSEDAAREQPGLSTENNAGLASDYNNAGQPAYQIIVGSFNDVSNAENYVESLQAKGFDAYIAGKYGMYNRVAIGRYSSQSSAMNALQDVREKVNYGAWLNDN